MFKRHDFAEELIKHKDVIVVGGIRMEWPKLLESGLKVLDRRGRVFDRNLDIAAIAAGLQQHNLLTVLEPETVVDDGVTQLLGDAMLELLTSDALEWS